MRDGREITIIEYVDEENVPQKKEKTETQIYGRT